MSDVTVDLASKVLELLDKSAAQVGQTVSTAFPYVVRYEFVSAVTGVALGVVALALALAGVHGFCRSRKKIERLREEGKYCSGMDEVLFAWMIFTALFGVLAIVFITIELPSVLEPTGATIEKLLRLAATPAK